MSELGWTDQVARIKQKMEASKYRDQHGNDVPLCVKCKYWRQTNGDLCEQCAKDEGEA